MPVNREAAERSGEAVGFSFGENWQRYLKGFDDRKLEQAKASLVASFGGAELAGHSFLDLGCGSGIFSLAARRLGAKVTSVDIDPASVACAEHLRGAGDPEWTIVRQSVLDPTGLPSADRVYSWGVLHHTGAMWEAVDKALGLVAPGGMACIALYNWPNRVETHMKLKRLYNRLPVVGRKLLTWAFGGRVLLRGLIVHHRNPITHVRMYGENARGMSFWRDQADWLGDSPVSSRSRMSSGAMCLTVST